MRKRWMLFLCVSGAVFCSLTGYAYEKTSLVSEKTWKAAEPYFLPEDHPAKPFLDYIVGKTRITGSLELLKGAGFRPIKNPTRRMIAASHPSMKGYLIKTFLDTHNLYNQEWTLWKRRIVGARVIQASIDRNNYNHLMKVPKKWIYPLPSYPEPLIGSGQHPQNFILVVEDMNIYDKKQNQKKYKKSMTTERLDALYVMLSENKLIDSIYIKNIPFSKDGKIAFVDTEFYNTTVREVPLNKISKTLSEDMEIYWKELIRRGGPN